MKAKYTEVEFKALSEPLQKELKQGEDKHYYPVIEPSEDGWAFENVNGLKSTMREERSRREEWERKHGELSRTLAGVEPDEIKGLPALKKKLKDMESWTPEEKVQTRLTSIENEYRTKLTDSEKQRQDLERAAEAEISELLIDDRARRSLEKLGTVDGGTDLLLPHVRRQTKVVRDPTTKRRGVVVVDEHGDPVSTKRAGAVGNMQLDELLEGYKKTWPNAFKGAGASGGGAGATGAGGSGTSNQHPSGGGDASKLTPEQRLVQLRRQQGAGAASR